MIYNTSREEYKVKFYKNVENGRSPVMDYIEKLRLKEKAKILKYIEFLRENKGYLNEPYSKHVKAEIRELRVDFARARHRIFYFTFIKKTIILIHAFLKKKDKTPLFEIKIAEERHRDVLANKKLYE